MKKPQLSLSIREEYLDKIKERAEIEARSVSNMAALMIERSLDLEEKPPKNLSEN